MNPACHLTLLQGWLLCLGPESLVLGFFIGRGYSFFAEWRRVQRELRILRDRAR